MWVKRIVQLLHQRLAAGRLAGTPLCEMPAGWPGRGWVALHQRKRQGPSRVVSGRRSRERLTQISPRKSSAALPHVRRTKLEGTSPKRGERTSDLMDRLLETGTEALEISG